MPTQLATGQVAKLVRGGGPVPVQVPGWSIGFQVTPLLVEEKRNWRPLLPAAVALTTPR